MSENGVKRWQGIQKLLNSYGPFQRNEFEPQDDLLDLIRENVKVLVIGAGGLGCELIKDLAMMGIKNIEVIDCDTIDLSNLNRQFLFRQQDIGRSKAEVAAEFVNNRMEGNCKVVGHFAKIQNFNESFYRSFHVIVCGLDNITARRWINSMLASLVKYNEQGEPDLSTIIPLIDGGTEGFKGNARVILFSKTACIECTLDLYPPQIVYPLCTLASSPRLPEHCIEYVRLVLWSSESPFKSTNSTPDTDNSQHIDWIFKKALERANQFNIQPLPTYRLTQGVIKNIIPAVSSTNAVIAAICSSEVFKILTFLYDYLNNYMNFNDADSVYTFGFDAQRKEDCLVCGSKSKILQFDPNKTLKDLIDFLKQSGEYQMKNPALTTVVNGSDKTLFINLKHLREAMQHNLHSTLIDLQLTNNQIINVTDETSPLPLKICLQFK